ncbi:histone deacetylase family protein [Sphingobacterium sp. LRF_L2]|uniref:histone deacetylase family protein n=1 Tax=Sphingobacterium sp. LRF_L2 TaxID=3369421 RepID=UPI003F5E84B6
MSLKIAHHPIYIHPVRQGHRFPMLKYELIPAQLLHEGIVTEENFFKPSMVDQRDVLRVHDSDYISRLKDLSLDEKMVRRIGFPLDRALVDREFCLVDGTVKASLFALDHGVAFNTAGGTHHAGRDFGEGFCLLNDQAIAAKYLLDKKYLNKVLIIDLDVHQGNGTAHIFEEDEQVFTFSMHGEKNFPFIKERSDLDVGLPDGMVDEAYLKLLEQHLNFLFGSVKPDFVFYQAGVDILATDKLGKLKMSAEGCLQRDRLVFENCFKHHVPVQVSMGGGYSTNLKDIVNAHVNTYRAAIEVFNI